MTANPSTPHSTQKDTDLPSIQIISAGAGSGKTYRLTQELIRLLESDTVKASGIIATTFTRKAAAELQERVRIALLEQGLTDKANELTHAMIGTVHGLGVKLLKRFAYEAGVSPEVSIIADEDRQTMFNNAMATVLTPERVQHMEYLSERLGLRKSRYGGDRTDWRGVVQQISEVARTNGFEAADLDRSAAHSWSTFEQYLTAGGDRTAEEWLTQVRSAISDTIEAINNNDADSTGTSAKYVSYLSSLRLKLKSGRGLEWHEWAKLTKQAPGAKSRELVADLQELARDHEQHPEFRGDIKGFIDGVFGLAKEAIAEYSNYKKQRGLIDYNDMELHVRDMLQHEAVRDTLRSELDLLMVDEFQDTNPLQLDIFLQLSRLAKHSIWVGDPKQSIYGFRGAEPRLMQAIIEHTGGIDPANIQKHSWRSREEIVYLTNALFCKAFSDLPESRVALEPKRRAVATADTANRSDEPIQMSGALHYWYYTNGTKRGPSKADQMTYIAHSIRELLEREELHCIPKGERQARPVQAGDIAILCSTNKACTQLAEALQSQGLKAAVAQAGLIDTRESRLILAALKLILHEHDTLSVAEVMMLAEHMDLEAVVKHRIAYLQQRAATEGYTAPWGSDIATVQQLRDLRTRYRELSGAEVMDAVIEALELRRTISRWGSAPERLANVDKLRALALQYEDNCHRLHTAASLGGMLLWLDRVGQDGNDDRAAGVGPDAVNVLTYHKSKGLEWPVVICHELDRNLRDDVFGLAIDGTEEVDLDNILAGRTMRYWVNPYADQRGKMPLIDRIKQGPEQLAATAHALQEDARVMYVGITRARDYLVLPAFGTPTRRLNVLAHEGREDIPFLAPPDVGISEVECPLDWKDRPLRFTAHHRDHSDGAPGDDGAAQHQEATIDYLPPRQGTAEQTPYLVDVAAVGAIPRLKPTFIGNYALPILPEDDVREAAKALKVYYAADHLHYTAELRQQMADDVLDRLGVSEVAGLERLPERSAALDAYLQSTFGYTQKLRKIPLHYHRDGQLFDRIIDTILLTPEGAVVIQHSSYTGGDKQREQHAANLSTFMDYAREGVCRHYGTSQCRAVVHFVLHGELWELV